MNETPLGELLQAVAEGLTQPRHAWEAAVIGLALLLATLLSRAGAPRLVRNLRRRAGAGADAGGPPPKGAAATDEEVARLRRVLFPLLALSFLWLGEGLLRQLHVLTGVQPARLVGLAASLIGTLLVVRVLFAALRRVLRRGAMLASLERAIGAVAIVCVALYATGALSDVIAWLDAWKIPLGHAQTVSLWSILAGSATTLGAVLFAMWLGALVDDRLAAQSALEPNLRTVLGRVVRALLLAVATLFALAVSGIDLTILSVFGGALGVGLGLGLQRIASNYVSGFILLLERSLRIGDIVAVDKYSGQVTRINTRATVLRQGDGTEAVIPNEMLVSLPVVNSTLTNRQVGLSVSIMIGPDADVAAARQLLCEAARSHPRVLPEPAPSVMLTEIRAGNLVLQVGFTIADPENGQQNVQSDVAIAALERLRAHHIELGVPRGDFRVEPGVGAGATGSPTMP